MRVLCPVGEVLCPGWSTSKYIENPVILANVSGPQMVREHRT